MSRPSGGEGRQGEAQASVPYFSIITNGSMTLPVDLDIFAALRVAHEGVQVDVLEGHLIHEVQAHHHHAGHPEEQDVEPGDEHGRGVERGKILGLVRPAHGAEGPQGGREPRVEHVGFLHQFRGAAIGAGRGIFLGNDELAALGAGPCRDAVAPTRSDG